MINKKELKKKKKENIDLNSHKMVARIINKRL